MLWVLSAASFDSGSFFEDRKSPCLCGVAQVEQFALEVGVKMQIPNVARRCVVMRVAHAVYCGGFCPTKVGQATKRAAHPDLSGVWIEYGAAGPMIQLGTPQNTTQLPFTLRARAK
jgi:hypothetical protein